MNQNNPNKHNKGPASLLAAIPHILGFAPINSLVLIALNQKINKFVMAIRLDLTNLNHEQIVNSAMKSLTAAKVNSDIDGVITALFADEAKPRFGPTIKELVLAQKEICEASDAYWVTGEHYGSLLCETDDCCSQTGWPLPSDTSLEKLQLISAGKSVLSSREEIADYFLPTKESKSLNKALKKLRASQQQTKTAAWSENLYNRGLVNLLDQDSELNDLAQAELIMICQNITLRDKLISEVLGEIQIAQAPLTLLHSIKARLLPLIQTAANDEVKGVLAVLAIWLWQLGEAVWAESATNEALAIDETYRLSLLTMSAIKSGLPPWKFADCFAPTG